MVSKTGTESEEEEVLCSNGGEVMRAELQLSIQAEQLPAGRKKSYLTKTPGA